MYFGSSFR
ncbi:uncharacterized protein FPRN_15258 [Fusarium proliferatum]|nr:uncharacterized protein FPRN_15258 [Fusarium proliferatum]